MGGGRETEVSPPPGLLYHASACSRAKRRLWFVFMKSLEQERKPPQKKYCACTVHKIVPELYNVSISVVGVHYMYCNTHTGNFGVEMRVGSYSDVHEQVKRHVHVTRETSASKVESEHVLKE